MPQHLQPAKQEDIEFSMNLDPLKKKKKPSSKKKLKSKKSKKDKSKKSKKSDSDESDNVEVNFDSEEFGGSSDETERTLMMHDSFSSDADSLKSAEKKKDKKKKEKKSKLEGSTDDKKEKKKGRKPKSERDLDLRKEKKKPKRSKSMVVSSKKEKKKERKVKSERNLEEKKEKKKKDKKIKSERTLDEMKEKKQPKRSKSEIVGVDKKTKKKDKQPKSERSLGEFVSRSFTTGLHSINEGDSKGTRKNDRSLLLDISNHTDPSFVKEEKVKLQKMSKAERKIMKPKIGEKFVEFCKSGDDEQSGLVLEVKGNFVFVKSVEKPAPTHNLHPRDRVIALNGKKIEDYNKDIDLITTSVESGTAVRLVISPTMLR